MHKHFLTVVLFFLLLSNKLLAQTLPPIQLDRPDQTECPFNEIIC
jgi:hypothetical protein